MKPLVGQQNIYIGSAVAQLTKTFGSLIVAVTEVDQFTIPPETHAAIKDYLRSDIYATIAYF